MEFLHLVSGLPSRKGAAYLLEKGKVVRRPHAELHALVLAARERLEKWGVRAGMRVGIYAPNSYDWLVHDLALIEIGAISVAFTDDFAGLLNQEVLDRYNVALLLTTKAGLKHFPERPAHVALFDGDNADVRVMDRPPSNDGDEADQLSLAFSSGSAGGLKGLVISRKGVEATIPPIFGAIGARPGDRLLLFLPMSNFQQRNMCYAALWLDFDIIITDYTQLFVAMKRLEPTILIAPPVLYQMVHSDFARYPRWKRAVWLALGAGLSRLPGEGARRALARRLFAGFYAQFGGRMRLLITGMAPIRRDIGRFFERMQLPLCESYGMVEAGSITYRGADSKKYGSVGKLLDGVKLSFTDEGEIIVNRDDPLTLRYFQCADGENERTFVGVNRVATGDIGQLDADGNLYLKGRKKELIITPGGVKIHPEVIEQELNNCPGVGQSVIFLKPDSAQLTCVVAMAQPETPGARDGVQAYVNAMQSTKKAAQFVEVIFADEPFSKENGMLRPNLKIDRKRIVAHYAA